MSIYKITIISGNSYIVVDKSIDNAYKTLKKYLDNNDYEFSYKRDLAKVEVIANKINDDDFDNIFEEINQ